MKIEKVKKTVEKIENLENRYRRNSTIIRKAHEIAEKFNDLETEWTIGINASTENDLDLSAAWFSGQVFKDGVAFHDFRVNC